MKKICILIGLLAFYSSNNIFALDVSYGQKVNGSWIAVPNGGTINLSCSQDYMIEEYIRVQNNTNQTFCLYMSKSYVQKQASLFTDAFCWDKCYDMNITKSDGCLTFISYQARDMDFHALYNPKGNQGETIIKYTFWLSGSAGDSCSVIVHFLSKPLGIAERSVIPGLSVSPNPCRDEVVFAFDDGMKGQGTIFISDLLGKRVKTLEVPAGHTEVKADLSSLADGVYICFTESTGIAGKSKKLIIKK